MHKKTASGALEENGTVVVSKGKEVGEVKGLKDVKEVEGKGIEGRLGKELEEVVKQVMGDADREGMELGDWVGVAVCEEVLEV